MSDVLLFRVTDAAGHFYTENASDVVMVLHDMRTGKAELRTITVEPVRVRQDEADILIGEYYEAHQSGAPAGGRG